MNGSHYLESWFLNIVSQLPFMKAESVENSKKISNRYVSSSLIIIIIKKFKEWNNFFPQEKFHWPHLEQSPIPN